MFNKELWEEITRDFKWRKWLIAFGVVYLIIFIPILLGLGMGGFTLLVLLNYPSVLLIQYLGGWQFGGSFLLYLALSGTILYALLGLCIGFLIHATIVIGKRIIAGLKRANI